MKLPTGASTPLPSPSFALQWTDKGEVGTRQGARHLFTAPIPEGWWDYWKLHKDELKKQGFSCGKQGGGWMICCWLIPAGTKQEPSKSNFSKILLEMSRAESSKLQVPFPDSVTPFPYQVAGVDYALKRDRVIIGDDMGLGKTLQGIGVCNSLESTKILVVCPAGLRLNWLDELNKFHCNTHAARTGVGVVISGKDFRDAMCNDVVVVSYDLMASKEGQKHLRGREWDVVIADEAHLLKNRKTKRAVGLLGLPPRSRGGKDAPKEPIPSERYLFLTGTPVSNRPEDFWNLLRFCAPEHFGNWTRYAQRFCDARKVPFGNGWDTSGASNLEELQSLVRGTCMVRRLKSKVLKQLPPKTRKIVALPTPADVVRELNALTLQFKTSEQTVALLKQRVAEARTAGNAGEMQDAVDQLKSAEAAVFTQTSRIRKQIGLRKVELAIEHITTALETSGGKVIVGAHHGDVIRELVEGLKMYSPVTVTGDTPAERRHEAVQTFQGVKQCRVFIGNILAAGTGLTLTAAPHVVIVEPDWVPANNAQFEDRAHRIGQSQPVLIEYLAMEQTIDIQVLRANARKMDVIEQATDRETDLILNPEEINYGPKGPAEPTKSVAEQKQEDSDKQQRRMRAIQFGQSLSPRELMAAHGCVKKVAILDGDHATAVNGVGFSKLDSEYGGRLARKALQDLTDFEKGRCASLAWKYRRQCPEAMVAELKPIPKK